MALESELMHLNHPSFRLDERLHLLSANPSGRDWLGLLHDSEEIHWDKGRGPSLQPILLKAVQTGTPQQDVIIGDPAGTPSPHLILVQALEKPEGRELWAQVIPLHEESLKTLDREGALAAERTSLALQSRQIGFWDWDVRRNVLTWDKTQYALFGIDPRDFCNAYEAWESTLAPESKEKAVLQIHLALAGKQNYNTEFEILTPAGERRSIRGSALCQRDEQGRPLRMIGLNWDVTHRRQLEQQILEQGRLTSKIADMIPTFLAIRDLATNRLTYFNRRLPEMLGYQYDEFMSMSLDDLIAITHPEDRENFTSFLQGSPFMSDDEVRELEIRGTTTKGKLIWVHLRSKIFERDPNGRPIAVITAGTEITEKKHLEIEAELGRAKAFNSSKLAALGEMAGGIAHEINNPLAIIVAKVEQIRKKLQQMNIKEPSVFEDIDRVQSVCQRIAKIIRSMRSLARTEDGETPQPIAIPGLLEEVLALCHQRFSRMNIRFEMTPPPAITVELRQIQVSQILLNLLNNAIDAVENLEDRWIRVDFLHDEEWFQISVTDSGQGIPAEVAQRMTEPFFTTKEVGKGTGLGLSISLAIAERHQGTLQYDPTGLNTRFVLTLPRRSSQHLSSRSK